jgi:uncharacterized BrkB/YihY/UPF0761 family membrane protein
MNRVENGILILLPALMLLPLWFSLSSLSHLLSDASTSKEGGVAIFWLAIYSIVIWLPYVAFSLAWRSKTNTKVKWVSALPFSAMLIVVLAGWFL